ncbi:hypothetical protein AV530_006135 [Patagioenas fasciata monilis]|uniref:Uncharacterized protein n=1 Tax=Patagioenas fasciata monilis TaxID=372326 RepID=A0A1V4J8V5_PATFA|nr:hypothetical protein AV530_006135 [Patagioenas fasciata monilis]
MDLNHNYISLSECKEASVELLGGWHFFTEDAGALNLKEKQLTQIKTDESGWMTNSHQQKNKQLFQKTSVESTLNTLLPGSSQHKKESSLSIY